MADKHWTATISSHGSAKAEFYQQQRISVNMLSHVRRAFIMETLVEEIISSLSFPKAHPFDMSQQFESQQNDPLKILYVQGGRILILSFHILVPVWDTVVSFIELILGYALTSSCLKHRRNITLKNSWNSPLALPPGTSRLAVHSAAARCCHAYLDLRLTGILFPEEEL